jgi:cytochrome b
MTRLWDWPVRLCHLLIITCVIAGYVTHELDMIEWHERNGFLLLGVVIFRILWGFFGSSTARFANFLRGPVAVFAYLKTWRTNPRAAGHNPVGGWAVVILLLLLLAQAGTGLFTWSDNVFTADYQAYEGPLAHLISHEAAKAITHNHKDLVFNLLLLFVGLHILANFAYWVFKTQNLITPMLTGKAPIEAPDFVSGSVVRLLLCIGVAAAIVWKIATL